MRVYHAIIGLAVCCAIASGAESEAPKTQTISLADCIEQALQHNLDVQIERTNPEISRYNLSLAYAGYDPVFSVSGNHDYSISPGGLDPQSRVYVQSTTDSDRFTSGLGGLLPTGLEYSLGFNITDAYGSTPGGPFENTRGSTSIRLTQPLLKNFWIDSTRMSISVSRKNLKMSELFLEYTVMSIATSVEQAYYDLIFAKENVKVQEKAMQLAERLLAENKKRVEVGALAPLDEKQAESQVAARRADLLSSQRLLATQQNTLKNLISDDYSSLTGITVEPSEQLAAVPQVFSLQDSWHKGMTMRPDLAQYKVDLERQDIVIRYNRNQLFPQLDLIGTYGQSASGDEFSTALGQIEGGDNPFYSFGAQMVIPLSNRNARYRYKTSKAQREQAVLRLKKLEQDIMVQIDNSIKLAQTNLERVDATRQARLYAEAALDAEQKKLQSGKSTSFVVLQLQRDLTAARSAEISALAEYNKAVAQLALAEGFTLERHNITVQFE